MLCLFTRLELEDATDGLIEDDDQPVVLVIITDTLANRIRRALAAMDTVLIGHPDRPDRIDASWYNQTVEALAFSYEALEKFLIAQVDDAEDPVSDMFDALEQSESSMFDLSDALLARLPDHKRIILDRIHLVVHDSPSFYFGKDDLLLEVGDYSAWDRSSTPVLPARMVTDPPTRIP